MKSSTAQSTRNSQANEVSRAFHAPAEKGAVATAEAGSAAAGLAGSAAAAEAEAEATAAATLRFKHNTHTECQWLDRVWPWSPLVVSSMPHCCD
jgi:hypothetical protein